jgi:hypothetical protein
VLRECLGNPACADDSDFHRVLLVAVCEEPLWAIPVDG